MIKRAGAWLGICLILTVGESDAEVVRFEIFARDAFADGRSFGAVGPYERVIGRVHYELDPSLSQNQHIVDLHRAPTNARGRVEFFGDLFILAPVDLSKGNGAVIYDVNNRGNKLVLDFFNFGQRSNDPSSVQHAGDGFLMRHGFTIVWSGWDGELLPGDHRLRLSPPVARDGEQPLTGLVRCEIVPESDTTRTLVSWANHGSYRPTEKGIRTATLTHRIRSHEPRVVIPRDQWEIHVSDVESDSPNQLPRVELEVFDGLQVGHIYELIYEARDPLVHGTCFASLRDLIAALKSGHGKDNPLRLPIGPVIERAYAFGVSQSGRFLREFLFWGFNADEHGRQVFDGVMPHVSGAGMGSFNHRFAQPTRHVTQHDHHDYPADRFPFAYAFDADPLSGQKGSILRRAKQAGTVPKIMHTQSSAEYWTRSGSLVHTDPLGTRDAQVPLDVRIYSFGGTQHGPSGYPPIRRTGKNLDNPADYRPFLRALLLALDRWVRVDESPPPSVYPTIHEGNLVAWDQTSTGFPDIPGVQYPQVIQQPSFWDYGPRWLAQGIVDRHPPKSLGDYRVLVPRCDRDGNEAGCLLPPEVAVPIATHTGWNLRNAESGAENELVSLRGSYVPFPRTKAEAAQQGDPRKSLEERYGTLAVYLKRLTEACRALERKGYLLSEDVERTLRLQRERVAPLFDVVAGER